MDLNSFARILFTINCSVCPGTFTLTYLGTTQWNKRAYVIPLLPAFVGA